MAITREGLSLKLARFLRDQSWQNDAADAGTAQLVCLRGCMVNEDGSLSAKGDPGVYTDHYDDTMIVFGQKANGAPYLETFKASAKPGLAWIRSPQYASANQGCPTVQPGQYRYVRGLHRGHQAMRQASGSPVCVIRDLDDDAQLEVTDRVDYPMYTGVNIHAGGSSSRVGLNSSGCQVIWGGWGGKPWSTFHKLIYQVAKAQSVFHYMVADFLFFGKWHDDGQAGRQFTNLLYGSCGGRVKKLQEALAEHGYYGSKIIDGEFGRVTDEGLRAYQRSLRLQPDGIATAEIRTRLGVAE
ncbi:MAG: peptidoglycan-binding domain-containing protein [Armatimonadia bacterium]